MKLGEAILERDSLEQRLELLESRLSAQEERVGSLRHLVEEIQQTANQVRDLNIAIDWTESTNSLLNLPISGHRRKIESHFRLAKVFEAAETERADELWRSAVNDQKIVTAATWLIDLQIPAAEGPVGDPTKEVE